MFFQMFLGQSGQSILLEGIIIIDNDRKHTDQNWSLFHREVLQLQPETLVDRKSLHN
jgi:hypothetical protein